MKKDGEASDNAIINEEGILSTKDGSNPHQRLQKW